VAVSERGGFSGILALPPDRGSRGDALDEDLGSPDLPSETGKGQWIQTAKVQLQGRRGAETITSDIEFVFAGHGAFHESVHDPLGFAVEG
jgi:hypothetical protein